MMGTPEHKSEQSPLDKTWSTLFPTFWCEIYTRWRWNPKGKRDITQELLAALCWSLILLLPTMDVCSVETNSKIQELYDRCNMVFCGYEGHEPTLEEIQWIRDLLGTMEAVDVGINGSDDSDDDDDDDDNGLISGSKLEEITYVHIHECDQFSIGVFCFPAGAQLPLHDHPEMVVLSRVLYGSVLTRAYDWVKPPDERYRNCGLARVAIDDQILDGSSPPSVLFPTSGGNLHSFTALTPCAILDVLTPPYSEEEGRPSTYYSELPIPGFEGFAVLRETPIREDLVVVGAPYLGPEITLEDDSEMEEDDVIDDDANYRGSRTINCYN